MKKHAPVIANLRELAKVSADMHSREPTDQLEWEAADLLQLYSDALVRLGDIKPLPTKDITGRKQVYVDLEARIEYAQTTVEVQDDPADWDICDEHETVFPRHGKCPCCDTVEGE